MISDKAGEYLVKIAKEAIESLARIPTVVSIASEFRYSNPIFYTGLIFHLVL